MEDSNQYTSTKVQPQDFISGWIVALVIAGTGLTLPILFLGAEVALAVGFTNALYAFGISTSILSLMCMVTTLIGNRSRLSTYMVLHFSFGRNGSKILNIIFGVILLGWFSVSLELLALAVKDTSIAAMNISIPEWGSIIFLGGLTIMSALYGIRSLEKLANFAVPLLTGFLIFTLFKTLQTTSIEDIIAFVPQPYTMTLFEATSILVGSSILFPVLMADFSRFVYNDKHSLIAVLGIALGFPVALILIAIPSIYSGETDIIKIMAEMGLIIPAFLLLFVSTWIGNSSNLYSTALTFSTLNTKWSYKNVTLTTGVFGIALSLLGFSNYLFIFLDLLGVFAPAISAIYMINFFWVRRQSYKLNEIRDWESNAMVSWIVSSIISLCCYVEIIQITQAYFLDSFMIGGILYIGFNRKIIYTNLFTKKEGSVNDGANN